MNMYRKISSMSNMDYSRGKKADDEQLVVYNGDIVSRRCLSYIQASEAKNFQPFRILDLEWDCRLAVLEACIPAKTVGVFLPGNYYHRPVDVPLPVLTKLNLQLRAEALYVYLSKTTFSIHSEPGNERFQAYLASIDLRSLHGDISPDIRNGFDVVHKLEFPFFSRFPYYKPNITQNNDIELMLRLPNLFEVSIKWAWDTLGDDNGPKAAATLRQQYFLDGLLEVKNLRVLRLVCPSLWAREPLRDLGHWFEKEFAKQQEVGVRRHAVTVEYPGKIESDTSIL